MLIMVACELMLFIAFLTMSCLVSSVCLANMLSMSTSFAIALFAAFSESSLLRVGLKKVEYFASL